MRDFAGFLFADPFRFFAIVIVACLLVVFLPKLHRLFHYVNPPPPILKPDDVTWRHALAEPVEAEKVAIFQNARSRTRGAVDADTLDAVSYATLAQALANLSVAGEDIKLVHALNKALYQYATDKKMNPIDAQAFSKASADKILEARLKRILDRAEESHHRKMKLADIDIRKMAYLVKKELEKDGVSG